MLKRVASAAVLLALSACEAVGPLAAASVGSVAVFGRGPADIGVSLVTGRDCSVVRLANGESYCKPVEPPPQGQPYCTRSLGVVDCWETPNPFGYEQRQVADGPAQLTGAQEQNRTARWPFK